MDLTTRPNDILPSPEKIGGLLHSRTHRPILDGQEVVIRSKDKSLLLNWDVLQLQWDLCRMASLCAAGDMPDQESDDGDWDSDLGEEAEGEEDTGADVESWLGER